MRRLSGIVAVAMLGCGGGAAHRPDVPADQGDAPNPSETEDPIGGDSLPEDGVPYDAGAVEPPTLDGGAEPATLPASPRVVELDGAAFFDALFATSESLAEVAARSIEHRLQILVSSPDPTDPALLRTWAWRADAEHFYPASAIKTFASVAALRAAREVGEGFGWDAPLARCRSERSCEAFDDPSNAESGLQTLRHIIRRTQIVSDNEGFNRLFDFVGYERFHAEMAAMGFPSVRVFQRLQREEEPDAAMFTPPFRWLDGESERLIEAQQAPLSLPSLDLSGTSVGESWVDFDDVVREGPMDFSRKDYVSLHDMHRLTLAIARPEFSDASLGLSDDELGLLREAMTVYVEDAEFLVPDSDSQVSERFKPMLPGIEEVIPRARVRYLNKAGKALGFHLDNAWIEDTETGRAFGVTVVLYVNSDGRLNDDRYDYSSVSFPFLVALGRVLAERFFVAE